MTKLYFYFLALDYGSAWTTFLEGKRIRELGWKPDHAKIDEEELAVVIGMALDGHSASSMTVFDDNLVY